MANDEKRPFYLDDSKDRLFTGRSEGNIFGARLYVNGAADRSRGLWFWREEEVHARLDNDAGWFKKGVEKMKAWLTSPQGFAKEPEMLAFYLRESWFPTFFQHRANSQGVVLTWVQVKRLHEVLGAELAKVPSEEFTKPDPDEEEL